MKHDISDAEECSILRHEKHALADRVVELGAALVVLRDRLAAPRNETPREKGMAIPHSRHRRILADYLRKTKEHYDVCARAGGPAFLPRRNTHASPSESLRWRAVGAVNMAFEADMIDTNAHTQLVNWIILGWTGVPMSEWR